MSKAWTRNIGDQANCELEVDLVELFGGQLVSDSSSLRQAVGQAIIDTIRERTQKDEESWTGKSFKNYSEEYADSVDFKAYGKSKNDPNLTQTGDMLGLMTIKEGKDPGKIVIGWDDTLQSEKAHGHITGNIGVKRDFFGLKQAELDDIAKQFQPDAPPESPNTADKLSSILEGDTVIPNKSLNSILDSIFGDGEDL